MDILLVSGRSRGPEPHPSRDLAAALARDLAELGHRVRWLCPVLRSGGPAVQLPEGATFLPVVSVAAPFRAVQRSVSDVPTECALGPEIRRRLPDVVHLLAFGGPNAAMLPWIADRLGAAVVVSVEARALLCHRGTLVNELGEACDAWSRPERCVTCCMTPFEGGLSAREARRGRRLSVLGRWSPYPKSVDFRIRLDVLVAALHSATLVLVPDDAGRDLLVTAGAPAKTLRVVGAAAPATPRLLELYEEARGAWASAPAG